MEHSIYWQMYCDVWTYHQKYINNLQDNDEFWNNLVNEGRALSKKYGHNRFIINLVLNEISEIEDAYKKIYQKRNLGVKTGSS